MVNTKVAQTKQPYIAKFVLSFGLVEVSWSKTTATHRGKLSLLQAINRQEQKKDEKQINLIRKLERQPGTQAFSSRSIALGLNVMTSPNETAGMSFGD